MTEYRILEKTYQSGIVTKFQVIGDGFLSFNAVWMAVHGELSRRIVNPPVKVFLQLEKIENGSVIMIGSLQVDDHPVKELLQSMQMPM